MRGDSAGNLTASAFGTCPRHFGTARRAHVAVDYDAFPDPVSPATWLHAAALWRRGITGRGIKVAVLDSGLDPTHSQFAHLASCIDFTGGGDCSDHVGHGTVVAGIIAALDGQCGGVAPAVQLHVFKVFDDQQRSRTSWFLDAFNMALQLDIDVVNLSIGGPDFLDHPFIDKACCRPLP